MAEYDIDLAKRTIKKESEVELPKLLNDHPNPITRAAASELFEHYQKLPESQKRKGPNAWNF